MRREPACQLGTATRSRAESPVEKDVLVQHHYRRLMELATCSLEWDAALLAAAPSLASPAPVVAPDVYEGLR